MKHTIELDALDLYVIRDALDEYIWQKKENERGPYIREARLARRVRDMIEHELQIDESYIVKKED